MQTRKLELFTTIHTEGAILPVDLLQRILDDDSSLVGTSPDSYHLGAGERINEAVNRSWNRLQGLWLSFQKAREKLPESDAGTSLTRDKWLLQLFQELGYGRLQTGKAIEHDSKVYDISHQWKHTPIHLVSFKLDLDKRQKGATGASKSSPHSLVQELLNASDDHLWGFVSNGLRLRILRDSKSLTRQSYVEFDVESMMDGEVYSDFVLLWMLCHQSRVEADKPEESWLERWSQTAQEQGTRALDQLRNGVEQAIKELGQGFLSHAGNAVLRDKLKSGALPTQEYYRQLFRLVYRLLFLFVAEDRDLLLHPKADTESRERYNKHYSLTRLRRMASKLRGSKHVDAWEQVRLVMDILSGDTGYDALGLPALGGYLFSDDAIPDLHDCDISNHDFLSAVRALAFIVDKGTLRPVDYKNLRSEEFGSVYESLLELHPIINADAGTFELKTVGGNERKTTASYYTHDSLVQCLLDSALDPVVDEACKKPDPEKAILALKVCDFASGSGHFLTAAAHRLAKRLAGIRTEEQEPAPEAIRTALRDVIGHCIYGVDINPMAVELCKVALWMEALEAGKPLSFLDHHIQCGNSLIGATPALLKKGIPDEAFTPIEGDDKEVCTEYKKRNKQEREKLQTTLFDMESKPWMHLGNLTTAIMEIDSISDATVDGVKQKQKQYEEFVRSTSSLYRKFFADTWCAAFVWKKTKEFPYPITEEVFRNIEKNPYSAPKWMKEEVERLANQYQFFHWQLAFPDVFYVGGGGENEQTGWSGGFDALVGNPPWERPKPEPTKYFEATRPDITNALTADIRGQYLIELEEQEPAVFSTWKEYERAILGAVAFLTKSTRFSLTAVGKFNLGNNFIELGRELVCATGRVGMLNVSGLATDDSGKEFIADLLKTRTLVSFFDFDNRKALFPAVHRMYKYSAITLSGHSNPIESADFVFFASSVPDLSDIDKHISFSEADILLLNPISGNCPVFRNRREAKLVKEIYRKADLLSPSQSVLYQWDAEPTFMFVMSDHSKLFYTREKLDIAEISYETITPSVNDEKYLPLYESKMFHQYDHRWTSLDTEGTQFDMSVKDHSDPLMVSAPRYWMRESDALKKMSALPTGWLIGIREVTNATNERTAIATILPKYPVGHNAQVFKYQSPVDFAGAFLANLNSFAFDFASRTKVGGSHLSSFILRQLPVLPRSAYDTVANWDNQFQLHEWVSIRVLELTYTAWDLQPFAQDCGYNGAPFKWDEERRFLLRSELDAAYFHLYGIERDDVGYIMDTFPIVRRKDESKYGEYRTKETILEMYDQMKAAMESGGEYQTWLDPPPADARLAHPARMDAGGAK